MSDFSSDHILETHRKLNEINWADSDICSECGLRFDEVPICGIAKCPMLSDEELNLENDDE